MSVEIVSENFPYLKHLNSRTRDVSVYGNELCMLHVKIGELLMMHYLASHGVLDTKIKNPQNKEVSTPWVDHENIVIIVLLRAGFYIAEGARAVLADHDHQYILCESANELSKQNLTNKKVVIVDSVINSGKTIIDFINTVSAQNTCSISVLSLVMNDGFLEKANSMLNVDFYTSRVSNNYYVGTGSNDTGNRLFGTF